MSGYGGWVAEEKSAHSFGEFKRSDNRRDAKGWGFMLLRQNRVKKFAIIALIITGFLFLHANVSIAESASIKNSMNIHRMGSYVILINYETRDKWTDNLLFKVHCKFDKGEFTFTSSALNNLERGWHKTQVTIPRITKKRYGSLRKYRIDLYKNGILVDTEQSY